jgi:hypothetical protein
MYVYICDVTTTTTTTYVCNHHHPPHTQCELTLDQAFESKDDISMSLKKALTEVMSLYGISIVQVSVR